MEISDMVGKSDLEKLGILKAGIANYAGLCRLEALKDFLPKKKTHRCSSVNMGKHCVARLHTDEEEFIRISPRKGLKNSDKDLSSIIESVFNKLVVQYSTTTWCKGEENKMLHIVALKQFWLDCYICDCNLMGLMYESLPNKIWVNIEGFYKSVEAARRANSHTIFSLKRFDKKIQKNFLIKKMLCKL